MLTLLELELESRLEKGHSINLINLCRRFVFSNLFIQKNLDKFFLNLEEGDYTLIITDLFRFQELSLETINYILSYCFKNNIITNEETLRYVLLDIIRYQSVDNCFIRKYANYVDWEQISKSQSLEEQFIIEYLHILNIRNIQIYQTLSEQFIIDHMYILDLNLISEYQILSEQFIEKYISKDNLKKIGENNQLSQEFILKYCNYLDMQLICKTQNLSEHTLRKLISKNLAINFATISWRQELSNEFIFEYFIFLDSADIITFQKLSEELMNIMWRYLDKDLISYHQKFSFNFFRNYKNDLKPCKNTKNIVKNGHKLLTLQLLNNLPIEILLYLETML